MDPLRIAFGAVVACCCLAAGSGCCCCQRGFSLRGDWSLEMDRLPNDCGDGHGECHHHADPHAAPDVLVPVNAAPATSPRFQPVPIAPVGDLMAPPQGPTATPPVIQHERAASKAEGRLSVLKQEPPPEPSSWMFVRRSSPPAQSPDAASRRQLTAEAWTAARRR